MKDDQMGESASSANSAGDQTPAALLAAGHHSFLGVDLLVGEDVLVPREETEILGREVLALLRARSAEAPERELRMIDMGCGAGNLACIAALGVPSVRAWAADISDACVRLTRANVARLGLEDRVMVAQGDLFAALAGEGLEGTMDLVVMNPPYIPSHVLEATLAGLLEHEPRAAFDGGPYGITIFTRLLQEAPAFLKPGGHLLFEFGLGQAKMVQALAERNRRHSTIRFVADAQGQPRVAVLGL
ncbi:N5-glutamine methyltransferase family protein [Geothrix alkalitolerans]|uniref:N5-glutamine methyltransferase family protein n=1 Tax=Geothrix alkalitolerans TaxID=2922724 RepID=UPI001FAEB449|nr:HemK family protein methyltransferase [Geothrix alkalitolerans]